MAGGELWTLSFKLGQDTVSSWRSKGTEVGAGEPLTWGRKQGYKTSMVLADTGWTVSE